MNEYKLHSNKRSRTTGMKTTGCNPAAACVFFGDVGRPARAGVSLIYLATISDPGTCSGTKLARTIAHEIGHQFGLDHGYDAQTNKIYIPEFPDVGLMHYTSCTMTLYPNSKGDNLIERHINLLRSRTGSPGNSIF